MKNQSWYFLKKIGTQLRYSLKFWLGLIVIVFGTLAFAEHAFSDPPAGEPQPVRSVGKIVYQTIQLFILESGAEEFNSWKLEIARYATLLLFVTTIVGLLTRIFQESFDSFRLQLLSGHTIVCGLGKIGQQIVDDAIEESRAGRKWYHFTEWTLPGVVVIELNASSTRVRRLRSRGGLVVIGDATNEELIESIGILKANRIFVATGSDEANAEIVFDCVNLMKAADIAVNRPDRLEVFALITDPTIYRVFSGQASRFIPDLPIDLRVFNPAANCARRMIESDTLSLRPKTESDVAVFVLIGFGKTGQAIALQLAELAHFENRKRSRMLIVEQDVATTAAQFTSQFGTFTHDQPDGDSWASVSFDDANDTWASRLQRSNETEQVQPPGCEYLCNASFIEAPKHYADRAFIEMIDRITTGDNVAPIVIICRDQDRENFDIAGVLADQLEPRRSQPLPIYTWLPEQSALHSTLESLQEHDASMCSVRPFGSCAEYASLDGLIDHDIELLAEKLHQDYQANYCSDRTGSCADWKNLPDSFRQSNRSAAIHGMIKLVVADTLGHKLTTSELDDDLVEVLSEMEHNRWMAERLLSGWRYGEMRNDALQERPSIQPWSTLPEEEREKDRSQVRTVMRIIKNATLLEQRKTRLLAQAKQQPEGRSENMKEKRTIAAFVQNERGDVLLTHNAKWGGYSFPMTTIADDDPPMGSTAISALESDIGQSLPRATAKELEYLGKYGVSERSGNDAFYQCWLFSVDPNETLSLEDAEHQPQFVALADILTRDDVTWTAKAIASELLSNREVSAAIVSRLGKTETEYLAIWNDQYGGYFLPSMRRKTETLPDAVVRQIFRDDFGYTGDIETEYKTEVSDIHFSHRFGADTQFRFYLYSVELLGLDIHQPYNAFELNLHERGIKWKWFTAEKLADSRQDLSATLDGLRSSVLAAVPSMARETALPQSNGVIALFSRKSPTGPEYLAQWNEHWKCYFLIGGHEIESTDSRERAIEKVCEELGVTPDGICVANTPTKSLAYEAISQRTDEITSYEIKVFDTECDSEASLQIEANAANRWLTLDEIQKGGANDGRTVSAVVNAVVLLEH